MTWVIEDGKWRVAAAEAEYIARCPSTDVAGVSLSLLPGRAAACVEHFKAS